MTNRHAGPSAGVRRTSLILGHRARRVARSHRPERPACAGDRRAGIGQRSGRRHPPRYRGTVAGTVFEDYNANGVKDAGSIVPAAASATDVGVKNATVTVVDSTGATVGTATTDAAGAFSVPVTAATADVRVKVTPPGGFVAGPHGPDSASTVQFVVLNTPPATAVEVALARPGDYAPDRPPLLNAVQVAAINVNGCVRRPDEPCEHRLQAATQTAGRPRPRPRRRPLRPALSGASRSSAGSTRSPRPSSSATPGSAPAEWARST